MALHLNSWQLTLAAVLQAKKKTAVHSTTLTLVRHFGGFALVPLAVLDSSIIPTFGSLDLITAWLAIGDPEHWWYYAVMSTAGSLIGALMTHRMGQKMGEWWIERKIGRKRLQQFRNAIDRHGSGAVFVSTVAPPPFPTSWFFVVAGAFAFPRKKFAAAILAGRAVRYGLLTLVAAHYGRVFLRYLRHPLHYLLISVIITASLIAAVILFGMRKSTPQRQPSTSTGT
jgi:membrane protein YqaA with SNARE-associated domain